MDKQSIVKKLAVLYDIALGQNDTYLCLDILKTIIAVENP